MSPQIYFAMLDAAGVKAAEIARKLGVSRAAVSHWRAGTRSMDDVHYKALAVWALGSETLFLATHHTVTEQHATNRPMLERTYGTAIHVSASPDYKEKMIRSFQFQLAKLTKLASGDPATWDYAAIKYYAQDVDGMARALAVIMADAEEGQQCPDTIPMGSDAKSI